MEELTIMDGMEQPKNVETASEIFSYPFYTTIPEVERIVQNVLKGFGRLDDDHVINISKDGNNYFIDEICLTGGSRLIGIIQITETELNGKKAVRVRIIRKDEDKPLNLWRELKRQLLTELMSIEEKYEEVGTNHPNELEPLPEIKGRPWYRDAAEAWREEKDIEQIHKIITRKYGDIVEKKTINNVISILRKRLGVGVMPYHRKQAKT
jgi:hypothetical protein